MDVALLNSKMNEYMFRLNRKMSEWLSKKLPKITDDWWQDLVINNLSPHQRENVLRGDIKEIEGLDLAALLRIVYRNWLVITGMFYLNNKEREKIHDMQQIRNDWAHIAQNRIYKEKVINDINVIIDLMYTFDASMQETRDMESLIMDVEEDKDLQGVVSEYTVKKTGVLEASEKTVISETTDITVGSVVTLVSNSKIIGAVIAIDGNSYSVLINGDIQKFYREQIRLQENKKAEYYLTLK